MSQDFTQTTSYKVRKQWAIWTLGQFRFQHPECDTELYESAGKFYLSILNAIDNFDALSEEFDSKIRPITCPVSLINKRPEGIKQIEPQSFQEEMWLVNAPKNASDLNAFLFLACPNLPNGKIDFDFADDCWVFSSEELIIDELQIELIKNAAEKVGLIGELKFALIKPVKNGVSSSNTNDMRLLPSKSKVHSGGIKKLVEEDEDSWREFIRCRETQQHSERASDNSNQLSCLFDAADHSDIHLSELLTIYDRIDLIPDRNNLSWMAKHNLSLPVIQELVNLNRLRIILPFPIHQYEANIISSVAEVNSSSLVLSRSLARKTIEKGQYKEPMLYAPLTGHQRADLLSTLHKIAPHDKFTPILNSYGKLFQNQHYAYMVSGATANVGYGVGAYLGDIIYSSTKQDARIELSVAGACMEWAMGLGSTFIPRSFGEGYDETRNCHLIASYLGRVTGKPVDPVAERMHMLTDGLLAVSNVPPLDVAKNFTGGAIARFRNLALQLMQGATTADLMQTAIDNINLEVRAYDNKVKRLTSWKIDSLIMGGFGKSIGDSVDYGLGNYSSIVCYWLYEIIKDRIPTPDLNQELKDALHILSGLAVGSTMDAVIVSRSKKIING